MSDAADSANDYQQRLTDSALAAVTRYEGESALECEECGDEIEEGRRIAVPGCSLCADCKSMREEKR